MSKPNVWVTREGDDWVVRREGAEPRIEPTRNPTRCPYRRSRYCSTREGRTHLARSRPQDPGPQQLRQ